MRLTSTGSIFAVIAFSSLLSGASGLTCHAQDSIARELEEAKTDFAESMAEANDVIETEIERQLKKVRNNKRLDTESQIEQIDALKASLDAFLEDGKVPVARSLQFKVRSYLRMKKLAIGRMTDAYDAAADQYADSKNISAAREVIAEKKQFIDQDGFPRPMKLVSGSRFVGTRKHSGTDADQRIEFVIENVRADGAIGGHALINNKAGRWKSTIRGSVNHSKLAFTTDHGKYFQDFIGQMTHDGMVVKFQRRNPDGTKGFHGTATLKSVVQNDKDGGTKR